METVQPRTVCQAGGGAYLRTVQARGQLSAGVHGPAIHDHVACAALGAVAAEICASLAQPQRHGFPERLARFHGHIVLRAIDGQTNCVLR
jgi:hypothetical protein